MTHASTDAPAAHYRLSTETWEKILDQYKQGATAPELSRTWRVSVHAIRKRITEHKATKRDWGDAEARKHAQARAEALEAERMNSPEARAARLFEPVEEGRDEGAGDPEILMRAATLASGRAMRGRLWAEAKALAGLAESYGRLARDGAPGGRRGPPTIESLPIELLSELYFTQGQWVRERMGLWTEADRDCPVKTDFWGRKYAEEQPGRDQMMQMMRQGHAAEARARVAEEALKAAGLPIPPSEPGPQAWWWNEVAEAAAEQEGWDPDRTPDDGLDEEEVTEQEWMEPAWPGEGVWRRGPAEEA